MSKILISAIFGLGVAFSAAAAEAPPSLVTLKDLKGSVSVNQGKEFAPATEGMRLKPGDRVMVQGDSEVDIQFDDQCKQEVDENKIVTIQEKSTCAGGEKVEQALNPDEGSAIGSSGAEGGGWPGNVVGPLIVASWAALGLAWVNNENVNDTVSP